MAVASRQRRERSESPSSPVLAYLEALHAQFAHLDEGDVAAYIPELAGVDPSLFGVCLVTVDGAVYDVGDCGAPFTIQSISKPLTYGLALELLENDAVHERVGVEPSGDPFNEISLAPTTSTPMNPMINAGAITCAGLLVEASAEPERTLVDTYGRYAGRRLTIDQAVYSSESTTGHRNRAIAHLLRNFGVLSGDPEAALDLYFRQCSVAVDCRDLGMMAATLANGGVNPVTHERAVREDVVRSVLSVMATCGMYDAAGEWLIGVGLPAKSGVAGGILAVLPGRLGVGVFSPRLDARGNSVRGVAVCKALSQDLALHLVRPGERAAHPVRVAYTLGEIGSKRLRSAAERTAIDAAAHATRVFELQGEVGFHAVEALSRAAGRTDGPELVVVDLRRAARLDSGGLRLLCALAASLHGHGGILVATGVEDGVAQALVAAGARTCPDLDAALEWCEDELLARGGSTPATAPVSLADHQLLSGLSVDDLESLERLLGTVTFAPGELAVRAGEPAAHVYLVTRGTLSVIAAESTDSPHRVAALSAGMAFGELAYVERTTRVADVRADSHAECRTLAFAALDDLEHDDPALFGKLVRNLLRSTASWLHVANREVVHLRR